MLNKKQLIQGAVDKTGLSDFEQPLGRLIDALNNEAQLNDFGSFRAGMGISATLCGWNIRPCTTYPATPFPSTM